MKRTLLIVLALIALPLALLAQDAELDGPAILEKADGVHNMFSSLTFKMKFDVKDAAGESKIREIRVWQKGDQRVTKFLFPPKDRGMAFLSMDKTNSFVYLPQFKKIRRIAAHVRNQTFLGTNFSYEDMSTTRYGDSFTAKKIGETDSAYILELTPSEGSDTTYGKLEMHINKEYFYIEQIHYFDKSGEKVKIEERSEYEKFQGKYWNMNHIKMTSLDGSVVTDLSFSDQKFDAEFRADTFTQRNLKKPAR